MKTIIPIRKQITVTASLAKAFEVFTAGMGRWWNPQYSIGSEPLATVVVEPREGGRWFERGQQGGECDWGRVLVWQPPRRVVLAWQITADWRYDPDLHTELEITFSADGSQTTLVELEHRGLESLGEQADSMRAIFDSPSGWAGLLERLATAAA